MKLTLNREYAVRHLGVAALFFGLACWFLYDAIFVYPHLPDDGTHRTTAEFQYAFAAALYAASFVVGFRVWLNRFRMLEWDDEEMRGPGTGGKPLRFDEIEGVLDAHWKRKGIIVFIARDGRRVKLDSWHQKGAEELVAKILPRLERAKG